jgi:hypothetical protein
MDTNPAIPCIKNWKVRCPGKIGGLGLHPLLGGLEVLSTRERPFDRVFSVNLVQFFPDKPQAYRDIFGVLGPGGIMATTYEPRHKNPTQEDGLQMAREVEDAMNHAGFEGIHTEELSLMPVPVVCVPSNNSAASDGPSKRDA